MTAEQSHALPCDIQPVLERERARIVRLCAYLSGDAGAAEDLAQETLLEAWRHAATLRDVAAAPAWLSGIARNVCLRWRRRRARELSRRHDHDDPDAPNPMTWIAGPGEVEADLERDDLARLLDQALAALPAATREILLERYVRESSYAAIADQRGMSEGSVGVRIHRGKLRLRHLLTTDLRHEALAMQLIDQPAQPTHQTEIWCSLCGEQRLQGRFDPGAGDLVLRCPACHPAYGVHETNTTASPSVFAGATQLPDAYERLITFAGTYFRQALRDGAARCVRCHAPARVIPRFPPQARLSTIDWGGVHVPCSSCGEMVWASLSGILLDLPSMKAFRRSHQRLRTLPQRQVTIDGQPALVLRYESIDSRHRRAIVVRRDTLRVLQVHDESILPPQL